MQTSLAKAAFQAALLAGATAGFEARAQSHWIGPDVGDWHYAANWSGNTVPGPAYTVVIDQPPTTDRATQITARLPVQVIDLNVLANLYCDTSLTISRRLDFRGGSLRSGEVAVMGEAVFSGPAAKHIGASMVRLPPQTRWSEGPLTLASAAQLAAGALFDVRSAGPLEGHPDISTVANSGTIRLNPAASPFFWGVAIMNRAGGRVEVESGHVIFYRRHSGSGTVRIAPGATADYRFWHVLEGGGFENAGEVIFDLVEAQVQTTIGGRVVLNGEIRGSGDLSVSDLRWLNGTLNGTGKLILLQDGIGEVSGPMHYGDRDFHNRGRLAIRAGSGISAGDFINNGSGVARLEDNTALHGNWFENGGVIIKETGSGSAEIAAGYERRIINSGRIVAQRGTLKMGAITGGQMECAKDAKLWINGDATGFVSTGDGTIHFGNGQNGGVVQGEIGVGLRPIFQRTTLRGGTGWTFPSAQIISHIATEVPATIRITGNLRLDGGFGSIALSCEGLAEIGGNVGNHIIGGNASLNLLGPGIWRNTDLALAPTGTVTNSGSMLVTGATMVELYERSSFESNNRWLYANNITGLSLRLSRGLGRLRASGDAAPAEPIAGTLGFTGKVSITDTQFVALNASAELTDLNAVGARIELANSTLKARNTLALQRATISLSRGAFHLPAPNWSFYDATISGVGEFVGDFRAQQLNLALAPVNEIKIAGSFGLYATRPGLTADIEVNGASIATPKLLVRDDVDLSFYLNLKLLAGSVIDREIPATTLMESERQIRGLFWNVPSGRWIGFRDGAHGCWVFYGRWSPYGEKRVVLVDIGSPFDAWRAERFPGDQLRNLEISGADADPDGNGYSNFYDYVFGAPPSITLAADASHGFLRVSLRDGTETFNPTLGISTELDGWANYPVGADAGPLRLESTSAQPPFRTFTYRFKNAVGSPALYIRTLPRTD